MLGFRSAAVDCNAHLVGGEQLALRQLGSFPGLDAAAAAKIHTGLECMQFKKGLK